MLKYDNDGYFKGYGLLTEAFRPLTKDVSLQPYIRDNDFGSTHIKAAEEVDNRGGHYLYLFDIYS